MNNPYELRFTLKQHTPIIHFQHDQEGATLRASEVKPKLDRFIRRRLLIEHNVPFNYNQDGKFMTEETAFCLVAREKGWLKWLNNETASLNYKLNIVSTVDDSFKFLIAARFSDAEARVLSQNDIIHLASSPYFALESEYRDLFVRREVRENNRTRRIPHALNDSVLEGITKKGVINHLDFPFTATINSCFPDLLQLLETAFPKLLTQQNFGTRQSKGFGSFSVEHKQNNQSYGVVDFEEDLREEFKFVYKKVIPQPLNNQGQINYDHLMQKVFREIHSSYQQLKSGIGASRQNDPGYRKSKLFLYGVANGIRWEKRKIKQAIDANKISHRGVTYSLRCNNAPSIDGSLKNNTWTDNANYDYRYLRAILGLAEQFEFMTTGGANSDKYVVEVESQSGIERLRSPILFKVFDNNVYLVGNDVDEGILNEKVFNFYYKMKIGGNLVGRSLLTTLKTPVTFNLGAFVKYSLQNSAFTQLK